jgi:predicted Fe-Mo cluster-binding NifX family protein
MQAEEIRNRDMHHAHGMCQPLKALGGSQVDAVVVAGIGMGALMKLNAQGIKIYRAVQGTVRHNLDFIREEKLPRFDSRFTCSGHTGDGRAHS